MTDFSELRRSAEAATKGDWGVGDEVVSDKSGQVLSIFIEHGKGGLIAQFFANCRVKTNAQVRANAEFAANASPKAVLALLQLAELRLEGKRIQWNRAEQLQAQVDALQKEVDQLRKGAQA